MGADWILVQDALIIAFLGIAGGALLTVVLRRLRAGRSASPPSRPQAGSLEDRVQVLERIATDRSLDLADQIDALPYPKDSN